MVYGDRIIGQGPPAGILARMRADPPCRKWQRVALHNGKVCLVILFVLDVLDILGDIDLSRTRLTTWCQTIVNQVDMKNRIRRFAHLHDPLGARLFAGPAAYTFLRFNHRKTLRSYYNGSKETCLHTASKAKATDSAILGTCIEHKGGPAIIDAHIREFVRCPKSARACVL